MRQKNALRAHFIAPFNPLSPTEEPSKESFKELAKWIVNISDDTDESTEDDAFYDGDGTKETSVTGVKGSYTFSGMYDPEDAAQAMVAGMKYKTGDSRKVWHKIISSDKKKQWVGVATVTDIVAGSGDASDYEEFKAKISYNSIPKETVPVGVGD